MKSSWSPKTASLVAAVLLSLDNSNAFSITSRQQQFLTPIHAQRQAYVCDEMDSSSLELSRRKMVKGSLFGLVSLLSPSWAVAADSPAKESKALSEEYRQGTAALADMDELAPVPREAYKKLPSGVVVADLRPGKEEAAKEGSRVNLQWVLRKSNGYFVDSSHVDNDVPFIFTVGDGKAISGLDEGVRGMKGGGVRRILIPPSLAYVQGLEDGKPGPVPKGFGPRQQMRRVQEIRKDVPGEYVFLEVQLTRVR